MNFSQFYFTEAKLSVLRQFLNVFAKEKKINIDLEKDIQDKGYFSITDASTFSNINEDLSESYKLNINLKKRKKGIKYDTDDKVLARMLKKRAMDIEAGKLVTDVYKVNITGGEELISPYINIQAAAAYETGKHLIHYGYIVMIIVQYIDGTFKHYVGADRLGLKFFKELFGTNMDIYLSTHKSNKGPILYDTSEEKPEQPIKTKHGYINFAGTPEETKTEFFNNIKESFSKKSNLIPKKETIIIKGIGTLDGYTYQLKPSDEKIGVYTRGAAFTKPSALVIVFYNGKNSIEEAQKMGLFDNIKGIDKPNQQIFSAIKYTDNIEKI